MTYGFLNFTNFFSASVKGGTPNYAKENFCQKKVLLVQNANFSPFWTILWRKFSGAEVGRNTHKLVIYHLFNFPWITPSFSNLNWICFAID